MPDKSIDYFLLFSPIVIRKQSQTISKMNGKINIAFSPGHFTPQIPLKSLPRKSWEHMAIPVTQLGKSRDLKAQLKSPLHQYPIANCSPENTKPHGVHF
jgi:hypothetical protein